MVFVTRSTTNLPLQSRSYNTPGINGFMETTMKIDRTDFLGKMEGFSLQGLKGMCNSRHCPLNTLINCVQALQRIVSNVSLNYGLKFDS